MDPIIEALRREIAQLEILAADQRAEGAQAQETIGRVKQLRTLLAQMEAPSEPGEPKTPQQSFDLRTNLTQWQAALTLDTLDRFQRIERKLDEIDAALRHQTSPRRRVSMVLSMIMLWTLVTLLLVPEVRAVLMAHPIQAIGIVLSVAALAGVIYWLGATNHV